MRVCGGDGAFLGKGPHSEGPKLEGMQGERHFGY